MLRKPSKNGVNAIWRKDLLAYGYGRAVGASPAFFPQSETDAYAAVEAVLHQTPGHYGLQRSRWRYQDLHRALRWLEGGSDAGIYKVLKRLGFSRKQALRFIHSPDPGYREKWQRILRAYHEALVRPDEVILLFQDEFTYYRHAEIRKILQRAGGRQQYHRQAPGANTKSRLTAAMNAVTGRTLVLQRSKVGCQELATFYEQIRQAYPDAQTIYLVQDNWPIHFHPKVLDAVTQHRLSLLPLPTYASWLNPIEKLWRWLRQDLLHNADESQPFKQLRLQVNAWFTQFENGSLYLLHYCGILSEHELQPIPVLFC